MKDALQILTAFCHAIQVVAPVNLGLLERTMQIKQRNDEKQN